MRWFQTDQCRRGLRSLQPVAVADQTFLHITATLQTTKVLSLPVITVEQIRSDTVTDTDTDTVTGNRKPGTDSVTVTDNRES
jgi:hypothetical protein